jgi:hypothetical protein
MGAVVRLRMARRLLVLAVVLNLMDVATGVMHWHGNEPVFRFFLGLMLGVGAGTVLFFPGGTMATSLSFSPRCIRVVKDG